MKLHKRLNSLPNVFERNKAAVDLFKKSGIELAPVMLTFGRERARKPKVRRLGEGMWSGGDPTIRRSPISISRGNELLQIC